MLPQKGGEIRESFQELTTPSVDTGAEDLTSDKQLHEFGSEEERVGHSSFGRPDVLPSVVAGFQGQWLVSNLGP